MTTIVAPGTDMGSTYEASETKVQRCSGCSDAWGHHGPNVVCPNMPDRPDDDGWNDDRSSNDY